MIAPSHGLDADRFRASQSAFAHALLHADHPLPPGLTTARGQADATRFALYRNNVFVGLTRALAQRFPVCERLVGEDFFLGMARSYAQVHQPNGPIICAYGDEFPDFIAQFPPAAGVPYLPDVARLEAAWTRAYHAADLPPADMAHLAALPADALPGARLVPHPAAALVRSDHPVGSIWAAHQGTDLVAVPDWRPEDVLVTRPDMVVTVHVLPPGDALFAQDLFAGATLAVAAQTALAHDPAFDFGAALVGLHALGAFASIRKDDPS